MFFSITQTIGGRARGQRLAYRCGHRSEFRSVLGCGWHCKSQQCRGFDYHGPWYFGLYFALISVQEVQPSSCR